MINRMNTERKTKEIKGKIQKWEENGKLQCV